MYLPVGIPRGHPQEPLMICTKQFATGTPLLSPFGGGGIVGSEAASNLLWVFSLFPFPLGGDRSHLLVVQNLDICLIGIPLRYI